MNSKCLLLLLAPLLVLAGCSASVPDAGGSDSQRAQSEIRSKVEKLLKDGRKAESVNESAVPALYEVVVDGRVAYVTKDGKYLVQGPIIELASEKNLTDIAESTIRRAALDKVGSDRKITFPAANQKYRITVFTDVECGYCRKLHAEITEYNAAGITVDYLLYARAGVGSTAYDTAVSVWCSADRRQALTDAKQQHFLAATDCPNPVNDNINLGHRFGFPGTPAMYAPDGTMLGGYLSPAELRARLDALAAEELKSS